MTRMCRGGVWGLLGSDEKPRARDMAPTQDRPLTSGGWKSTWQRSTLRTGVNACSKTSPTTSSWTEDWGLPRDRKAEHVTVVTPKIPYAQSRQECVISTMRDLGLASIQLLGLTSSQMSTESFFLQTPTLPSTWELSSLFQPTSPPAPLFQNTNHSPP